MAGMTAVTGGSGVEALVAAALHRSGAGAEDGVDDLLARARRWGPDLQAGVAAVFPDEADDVMGRLAEIVVRGWLDRSPALRARDRERLLTPDWFQRPDALGYVAYADRFADTLAGVAGHVDYLRELGTTYLHLMPLLAPAPGRQRRRLRRRRLPRGARRPRVDGRPREARVGAARQRHRPDDRPRPQPRRPRARVGGRGTCRRPCLPRLLPRLPRPHRARPLRADAARGVPGLRARQLHVGRRGRRLGLDDLQLLPVGPQLVEPRRCSCEFADLELFLANRGVDCLRLDAIAFLWKRLGTDSPEPARGARAHPRAARGGPHRRSGPGVQGRGDRRPRARSCTTSASASTPASSPTWRTTTASWCRSGRRSPRATSACSCGRSTASRPSRPPPSWATYLRCHDDIGWAIDDADAASVGLERRDHRSFLSQYYVGDFPGSFCARRGLPGQRGHRRQPDQRQRSEPRRRRAGAGVARRRTARARAEPAALRVRDRLRLRRHPACCTWATSSRCSTTSATSTSPSTPTTTAGCTGPGCRGTPPRAATTPPRSRAACFATLAHLGRVRASLPTLHAAVESRPGRDLQPGGARRRPSSRGRRPRAALQRLGGVAARRHVGARHVWPVVRRRTGSPASRRASRTASSCCRRTPPSGSPPSERRLGNGAPHRRGPDLRSRHA